MKNLESRTIVLRLAEADDAEFVYGLRVDPQYNKYLSQTSGNVEDQRQWLLRYKEREARQEEYYFIIVNKTTKARAGTVRLYDFRPQRESFCWGSWILNQNKTRYAAVEFAMLVYELAFRMMHFRACHFDVRKENDSVVKFHIRFGAKIIGEDEANYYFNIYPSDYYKFLEDNAHHLSQAE
ncbi:GNAT family N-acetyltransferase [Nitrobacteraceae bacterium UC4449_H16]